MDIISIFLIAAGLAMDALAVSMSNGMAADGLRLKHAVKMGFFCGAFQFAMPLIGMFLGATVSVYIEAYDHWIIFLLLGFIGGKMIVSFFGGNNEENTRANAEEVFGVKRVLPLALATSIDALAVGVGFALLDVDIWLACAIIGVVAFCCSLAGVMAGKAFGAALKTKAELFGGVVLVLIGVKVLLEHLL